MPSFKVIQLYSHAEEVSFYPDHYQLTGTMIHWINEHKYCRYNTASDSFLDPIDLRVKCRLIAANGNKIEVLLGSMGNSYLTGTIDIKTLKIKMEPLEKEEFNDLQMLNCLCDTRQDYSTGLYHPEPLSKVVPRLDPIPLEQEGYEFQKAIWDVKGLTSLWTKNGTYHILGQSGMKDTKVRDGLLYTHCHVFQDNLVMMTRDGLSVNGERISTFNWDGCIGISNYVFNYGNVFKIIEVQ